MEKYIVYKINEDLSMSPDVTFEESTIEEVDAYLLTITFPYYQVEFQNQFGSTVIYQVLPPPPEPPPEEPGQEIDVTPQE